MDRREGARILRETVALLEALEQDRQEYPTRTHGHLTMVRTFLLDEIASMRSGLEGVAERLAEDEARESEASEPSDGDVRALEAAVKRTEEEIGPLQRRYTDLCRRLSYAYGIVPDEDRL